MSQKFSHDLKQRRLTDAARDTSWDRCELGRPAWKRFTRFKIAVSVQIRDIAVLRVRSSKVLQFVYTRRTGRVPEVDDKRFPDEIIGRQGRIPRCHQFDRQQHPIVTGGIVAPAQPNGRANRQQNRKD